MHASEVTPEVMARANELYWSSKRSVNQIADDLDLSKGALYGVIEPLLTGLACPRCGAEVVVPNRTARERDLLDCPSCEWDGGPDETVSDMRRAPSAGENRPEIRGVELDHGETDTAASPPIAPNRTRTIAGGALLGAAVGLALVAWARRR